MIAAAIFFETWFINLQLQDDIAKLFLVYLVSSSLLSYRLLYLTLGPTGSTTLGERHEGLDQKKLRRLKLHFCLKHFGLEAVEKILGHSLNWTGAGWHGVLNRMAYKLYH